MKLDPAQQLLDEQPISVDVLLEKYAKGGEQSADDVSKEIAAIPAPSSRFHTPASTIPVPPSRFRPSKDPRLQGSVNTP